MSRTMRIRNRVSYFEPKEPSFDDYVFCTSCGDYVYEYCSIHGPLLVIPDDEIFDHNRKPSHALDASDANNSNWMRYVNCSRHYSEQNLVAFQYRGRLYYRTIKIIPRFTELLVFYGSEFASELNIDLRRYHSPAYTETLVKCEAGNEEMGCNSHEMQLFTDTTRVTVNESLLQDPDSQEFEHKIYHEREQHLTEGISLENHLKEPINDSIYSNENKNDIYDNCGQSFNEKPMVNGHFNPSNAKIVGTNIDDKLYRFSCPICNAAFATKSAFINHDVKIHNSIKVYEACTICDFKTVCNRSLRMHIERHSAETYKCDICKYETPYKSYIERHMKRHAEPKCKICKDVFKTNRQLRRHSRIHRDKMYDCTICDMSFIKEKEYKTHFETHNEKRPHSCETCGKMFRTLQCIKRHMKIHSQEKSYVCEICNNGFQSHYNLKRHLLIHSKKNLSICKF